MFNEVVYEDGVLKIKGHNLTLEFNVDEVSENMYVTKDENLRKILNVLKDPCEVIEFNYFRVEKYNGFDVIRRKETGEIVAISLNTEWLDDEITIYSEPYYMKYRDIKRF